MQIHIKSIGLKNNFVVKIKNYPRFIIKTQKSMKNFTIFILSIVYSLGYAQSTNDILNILVENKTIAAEQADSLRAEAAIKQQAEEEKRKSFQTTATKPMQFSGYIDVRYRNLDASGSIDGFDLRRAYFDVKGKVSPSWNYRLQVDFAYSPKIIEAYAEYNHNDYFNFIFGQTLIPFSLENLTGNTRLLLIDRSQVVEALAARGKDVIGNQNGRDIGIFWKGGLLKKENYFTINYNLAIISGSGINVADKNESQDIVGRVVYNPIKNLGIGASYYNGYAFVGNPGKNQLRNRYGFELAYKIKAINLCGEYIKGLDDKTNRDGFYAQLAYNIIKDKLQAVVRYDHYNPNITKLGDLSKVYTLGTTLLVNKNLRLQAEYNIRKEEIKEINNNIGAIQLQIIF